MQRELVDLHIHTTASDGCYPPSQIVSMAIKKGLKAIAITDHDTVAGIEEAVSTGKKTGFEVVPGVELSVDIPNGTMHILGYYIDYHDKLFNAKLEYLRTAREERNVKMVEKLALLGIDLPYDKVLKYAQGEVVGRAHFAHALVKNKIVKDFNEAFETYLKRGGPAYVEKEKLSPEEAIRLLKKIGGIPVLAHPRLLNTKNTTQLKDTIRTLTSMGLRGIEAYYSAHSKKETYLYLTLAEELSLLVTGGTDYHGEIKPDIKLGSGMKNLAVPYSTLAQMKKELSSSKG